MADYGIIALGIGFWTHRRPKTSCRFGGITISSEALGRGPTPEASQKAAIALCDSNSETDPTFATLQRQERWVEPEERWVA